MDDPAPPTPEEPLPARVAPQEIVAEAFRRVLLREADEGALAGYSDMLRSGAITHAQLLYILLDSDEFAGKALERGSVAARVAETRIERRLVLGAAKSHAPEEGDAAELVRRMFVAVLRREPDPQGLDAYGRRLEEGALDLPGLVAELIASDEFGRLRPSRAGAGAAPRSLGRLAEDLILRRLNAQGCRLPATELGGDDDGDMELERLRALLLTLAMVGAAPADGSPGGPST